MDGLPCCPVAAGDFNALLEIHLDDVHFGLGVPLTGLPDAKREVFREFSFDDFIGGPA